MIVSLKQAVTTLQPDFVSHVTNKQHCLTERDSMLAHYSALFWSLGLLLRYLASSGTKSNIIFLLCDPDLPWGRQNFMPISHRFRDPHVGLFEGLQLHLGYLASSDA